jgi:hypothetical protein
MKEAVSSLLDTMKEISNKLASEIAKNTREINELKEKVRLLELEVKNQKGQKNVS